MITPFCYPFEPLPDLMDNQNPEAIRDVQTNAHSSNS